MLKMWKTFCRKNAKNPDFPSIKVGCNQSFPHSRGTFNISRQVFNKTLFFRYLSKTASFSRVLQFFKAFLSASVFRGGQVRNLGESADLASPLDKGKRMYHVGFWRAMQFDKAY
jgi:hypothetical protein